MEEEIIKELIKRKEKISCMESCTGGFLASTLTNVSGSSEVLEVSLVTYSNKYKEKFGVSHDIIQKYSVYSIETAREMAKSVSNFALSNWGIGITGQIGRYDPKNIVKDTNVVYYSIYNQAQEVYFDNIIKLDGELSRKENKIKIVEEILNTFYKILKEG